MLFVFFRGKESGPINTAHARSTRAVTRPSSTSSDSVHSVSQSELRLARPPASPLGYKNHHPTSARSGSNTGRLNFTM